MTGPLDLSDWGGPSDRCYACDDKDQHIAELEATNKRLRDEKATLGRWYETRLEKSMDERLKRVAFRLGYDSCEDACAEMARLRGQVERMRRRATAARNELDNPAYRHLDCRPYLPYEALEDIAAGCPDDEGTTGSQTEEVKDG